MCESPFRFAAFVLRLEVRVGLAKGFAPPLVGLSKSARAVSHCTPSVIAAVAGRLKATAREQFQRFNRSIVAMHKRLPDAAVVGPGAPKHWQGVVWNVVVKEYKGLRVFPAQAVNVGLVVSSS